MKRSKSYKIAAKVKTCSFATIAVVFHGHFPCKKIIYRFTLGVWKLLLERGLNFPLVHTRPKAPPFCLHLPHFAH